MTTAIHILFSALFLGSLYAMMAIGLALVWTTIGVFNFAHGALMTLGAYFAWQFVDASGFGLPFFVSLPLALLTVGLIGYLLQASVVRPFIGRDDVVLVAVITTLAASSILENGTLLAWGPRPKQISPLIPGTVDLAGVAISAHQIAIIMATAVIVGALWFFLNRTRLGLALRAVAQNEEACHLVGVNVVAVYALAVGLAAALAALVGIFLGGFKFMSPAMGTEPLSKAMIVVIFGGISNISGPILAAFIIGLFEAASTYFIGFYWTPTLLFFLLIAVLMIRPDGLLTRGARGLA